MYLCFVWQRCGCISILFHSIVLPFIFHGIHSVLSVPLCSAFLEAPHDTGTCWMQFCPSLLSCSIQRQHVVQGHAGWHSALHYCPIPSRGNMWCRDMLDASPGVSWDDIAGLAEAKRVLQENVILPLYMPEYFQGIRRPVKVLSTSWEVIWGSI